MSPTGGTRNRGIARHRTPFEWTILIVSLAATVALVVGLVVSEVAGSDGPADLRVTVAERSEQASGGRALEVTVENAGGEAAENVIVEVTAGDVVREVDLDLVAEGDSETAAVVFPPDSTGEPRAEVVSYTKP